MSSRAAGAAPSAGKSRRARRSARRWSLFGQLSATSIALVVTVIGAFAVSMIVITRADVTSEGQQQRHALAGASALAAAASYRSTGGWVGVELAPIFDLAAEGGYRVTIADLQGATVGSGGATIVGAGRDSTAVVTTGALVIGRVTLRFPASGLTSGQQRLQRRLVDAALIIGAVAAVVAAAVALLLARRVSRPLHAVTRAVAAMERGDRSARVADRKAVAEVRALASGVNQMAETVERQGQLREALVADIAHELRTPIAVLQATTESVLDGMAELSIDVVVSLHEEVVRLAQRVEDLRAYASAQITVLGVRREPLDLGDVAGSAARAVAARFDAHDITLTLNLQPVTVLGDEDRIFQVIVNLLTNAEKFTAPGGRVGMSVRASSEGAELTVDDNGVGIPLDEQHRIFDRFWRSREVGDRPGSGIGLAIVAELVAAHGGTITVESIPGTGTIVHLHLPGPYPGLQLTQA